MSQHKRLEFVAVPQPCSVAWESMTGDGPARTCGACERQVFDLASMTSVEAETLLNEQRGRLCIRLCRAEDGQVLTADRRLRWQPDRRFVLRMSVAAIAGWIGAMQPLRALAALRPAAQAGADGRTAPMPWDQPWYRRDGMISGVITDPSGLVLPGAEIVVVRESTRREFKTRSADDGRYSFSLPEGTYTVKVHLDGFESFAVDGVKVVQRCNSVVDHTLLMGFIGERIVVPPRIVPVCRPPQPNVEPREVAYAD